MKAWARARLMRFKVFLASNAICCIIVVGIVLVCMLASWVTGLLDAHINFDAKEFLSLVKMDAAEVFAIIAVAISLFAMLYTKQINSSTFIASFWERYWDTDMLGSIRTISALRNDLIKRYPDVKTRNPINNPESRIKVVDEKPDVFPWTKEQDAARRILKGYYLDILAIYKKGVLSHADLCDLCKSSAYTLLFDVVETMEQVLNKNYSFEPFYELMTICGKGVYGQNNERKPRGEQKFLDS